MNALRFVVGVALLATCVFFANAQAADRPPNIVFINADDLGWGDLGAYGGRAIRTPHLDRMAKQGLRLTNFYSVSPVCTPSRAALLTGRYAARMGATNMNLVGVLLPSSEGGLPAQEVTVARALATRGYATACIGKWHLGSRAPHRALDHGFAQYFGIPYSNDMQPVRLVRGQDVVEEPVDQSTLTRRYTEDAIRFIGEARDRPFFLYFAHAMPHIPLHASPAFAGKSRAGPYGDAVEELDWSVGQILDALRRVKVDRRTIVFFSSDNGPWYEGSPGPLRGRKGWTTDGGIRVPGIVWWPGTILPRVSDFPIGTIDFFPTALGLTGGSVAASGGLPIDGRDMGPWLLGKEREPQSNIYLFFDSVYLQTARMGRFKIHVAQWDVPRYVKTAQTRQNQVLPRARLFDMTVDPAEAYDLAKKYPDVVQDLTKRLTAALRTFPEEIRAANAALLGANPL